MSAPPHTHTSRVETYRTHRDTVQSHTTLAVSYDSSHSISPHPLSPGDAFHGATGLVRFECRGLLLDVESRGSPPPKVYVWRSSLFSLTFTGVRSEQVGRAGGRDHHHLYGAALPRHAPPPRSGTRSLVFQRALERTRIRMPPDSASGEPRSLRHLIPQTGCIQLLSLSSYPSCSHGALSTLHEAVFPPRGWRAYTIKLLA